jgi:hypothetical protein
VGFMIGVVGRVVMLFVQCANDCRDMIVRRQEVAAEWYDMRDRLSPRRYRRSVYSKAVSGPVAI